MKISDALSRLVRTKSGDYEVDMSDEILNEVVIASSASDTELELLQLHQKNGHCSAERLSRLSNSSREKCAAVVKQCGDCVLRSKVIEQKQIFGTIMDNKIKNDTWFIDFVYFKNVGSKYMSILDRSTRFFMAAKVDSRKHNAAIEALESEIARMGKPNKIISDREFISNEMENFCKKYNIEHQVLTRESPFLNLVERYHQEIKAIAVKSDVSFERAIDMLNNLPFSNTPPGVEFKNISPAKLFFENDKKLIKIICDFLENESRKRSERGKDLRGINITRFHRKFNVGDIVRFNMGKHKVGFGRVTRKISSKMFEIERIDGSGSTAIHAQQLQLVTISEEFLKRLLDIK